MRLLPQRAAVHSRLHVYGGTARNVTPLCNGGKIDALSSIGGMPYGAATRNVGSSDISTWSREMTLLPCMGSCAINRSSHRSIQRFSSTGSTKRCRTDISSTTSSSATEPTNDGREFIWRTTERRFIDFCLSPEEEQQLKRLHEKIVTSPSSSISDQEVAACLLPTEESQGEQPVSMLQKLCRMGSYLLSPRGIEEDGRRLFRTAIPVYENTGFTEKYFGINEGNFNGRIYFLLLHFWSLHRALQQAGAETLKIKLWDALWDFLTNHLLQERVSEFKIPAILREQQFVSLGFCVSLDEAFEDESSGPAGQLAHRLWVTIYEAARDKRECPELIALATYALLARSFALQLPRDALLQGAFKWPEWPPSDRGPNNREAYFRGGEESD